MTRTKLFALLVCVLVCSTWFPAYAQERVRIGISAVSLGFLPTVIAEKKGFYTKYGLVAEHVLVPCTIATNALLSDDLDYAVCTGPGIAGAIKGLPFKLVMTTQDKLGYLLLVKPNVQKLTDLRGKTVGISTFGSQLYLTSVTLFRKTGMQPGRDVNLLPAGDNTARIASMESGKIDAAFVSSPADIFWRQARLQSFAVVPRSCAAHAKCHRGHGQKAQAIGRSGQAYDQRQHRGAEIHSRPAGGIGGDCLKMVETRCGDHARRV